jgi:hypothetical protein
VHEQDNALGRKTLAPFKALIPHMQLDARIDSRDHECLGDDSLRIGRGGYESSDQQGDHNSNMAHGVPLQTVIGFLASAIAICRRARTTHSFAPRTSLLRRGGRSIVEIFLMHYSSCLAGMSWDF